MRIEVLDHGYVELIETWGTGKAGRHVGHQSDPSVDYEVGIIEAARQSTQGSFRGWDPAPCDCTEEKRAFVQKTHTWIHDPECASVKQPGDAKLLSYLYKNKHSTPFEFAGMVVEVQAPIFVFREWHRHRTQSYSEASARYAPLPDLNYIPSIERILAGGGVNKQAGAAKGVQPMSEPEMAETFQWVLRSHYQQSEDLYQAALTEGVPKELARLVIPVGRYSKMRTSTNLRNWLAFMTLRCDPNTQWETQQYGNAVATIIEEKFPQTFNLWKDQA